jgi:hypothetical protein
VKRLLGLIALLTMLASGCFGSGGGAGSAPKGNASSTASGTPPATSLRFSYPVGQLVNSRSRLSPCPAGATCQDLRLRRHCIPGRYCPPRPWLRIAVRRLTCSPSGGDYQDAEAACAALDDLEHRLQIPPVIVCFCPAEPAGHQKAKANGRYRNHHLVVALDFCTLCSFGREAAHDAAVLMPQH